MEFAGYSEATLIYEGATSRVYRAKRNSDGQHVILKALSLAGGERVHMARYQREYETVKHLKFPEAIQIYGLFSAGPFCVMEMEDFGGESLAHVLGQNKPHGLPLKEALEVSAGAAAQLASVHGSNVIHKDVNPANIVWNRSTGQIKLIDFGIASTFSSESPRFESIAVLEGTLVYVSPEQTGRMNRALDYRTDLYSLGATLYEVFTGRPPFAAADPLELVHSHLAKRPIEPSAVNPQLPGVVSNIIMRLLAKGAEERYQSASGLHADLQECLRQLRERGTIVDFPLAKKDFAQTLQISQRLYGRDKEIATLLAAFDRAAAGGREFMMVCGYSGIGKTALVHEVHRPITERHGQYISGKYDQFQQHIPNSALVDAFRSLLRQILAEDESSILRWREKLHTALDRTGAAVAEVIPELEQITGELPPLEEVNPAEAQSRFQRAFRQFVRALASADHPLVMFLDDLQWADPASLSLIEHLMKDWELRHFFLIGAYRDHEVDAVHPLTALLERVQRVSGPVPQIAIRPLSLDDLGQLLADTLNVEPSQAAPLSQRLAEKTGGNPFFTLQFIKSLYRKGLLFPQTERASWAWDIDRIDSMGITENVVELVTERLHGLPAATQHALQVAALLGNHFSLFHLATSLELPPEQVYQALHPAISEGILVPASRPESLRPGDLSSPLVVRDFGFAHDRLQQAAFGAIPESERQAAHLRIGRLLRDELRRGLGEDTLFTVVGHLNAARESCHDAGERLDLAQLNLEAGRRAIAAQAYAAAATLLRHGMDCLPADAWASCHDLAYGLYTTRARAEGQISNQQEAMRLLRQSLPHASSRLEKLRVYSLLLRLYGQLADYPACHETACAALELFDMKLARSNFIEELGPLFGRLGANLARCPLKEFVEQPALDRPDLREIQTLLFSFFPSAHFVHPTLAAHASVNALILTLETGVVPESAAALTNYAMVLMVQNRHQESLEAAHAGLRLTERFSSNANDFAVNLVLGTYILPWTAPIADTYELQDRALHFGLQGGAELAELAFNNKLANHFFGAIPLDQAHKEFVSSLRHISESNNIIAHDSVMAIGLAVANLTGQTKSPDAYHHGNIESGDAFIQSCLTNQSMFALVSFLLHRGVVKYLYGDFRGAYTEMAELGPKIEALFLSIQRAFHPLVLALSAARLMSTAEAAEQQELKTRFAEARAQVALWAANCPANFLAPRLLIDAEQAILDGDRFLAVQHLTQAAEAAQQYDLFHIQGAAEERLADFWQSCGLPEYSRIHAIKARQAFLNWGAHRKVALLDEKFKPLGSLQRSVGQGVLLPLQHTVTATTSSAKGALDVLSVVKASQSIAEELVLDRLLERLVQVLLEQAGAERGALLLHRDGELKVEAFSSGSGAKIQVRTGTPLSQWQDGARSIVQWVIRTQQSAVVGNASNDAAFRADPYVVAHKTRSVLCTPIKNRAGFLGIVYLENNLSTDAFTAERLEVLRTLAGQVAVSLENARLYEELSQALMVTKESERLKTEFLANTSHELRTPLNSIINIPRALVNSLHERTILRCVACGAVFEPDADASAEDLRKSCPECQAPSLLATKEWYSYQSPGELRSYLESVESSGNHLLLIVDNLLDYTRLEAGRVKCRFENVAVPLLMETMASTMGPLARARNIGLEFHIGAEAPTLHADPVKLRQILTNLIGNAIKFSHPEGRVLVEFRADANHGFFSVQDFGIGIAKQSQSLIFERFRQLDAGHNRSYGGTGLGLAITKKLVELHEGQITVDSELGVGSTFTVKLPLQQQVTDGTIAGAKP